MLLHRAYAASLLFLLSFILFQPCQQSPINQRVSLKGLNNALVSNVRQFFADTKKSRDFGVMQKREGMLQVLLNNHGMQQINRNEVSNSVIARHLSVPRKTVAKHRDNKYHSEKHSHPRRSLGSQRMPLYFSTTSYAKPWLNFGLIIAFQAPTKKMSSGKTRESKATTCEHTTKIRVHIPLNVQLGNAQKINAGV